MVGAAVTFSFSGEAWAALEKIAVVRAGNVRRDVTAWENGTCAIPWECLRMPGEHGGGGVCDLHETVLAHFEHADLVGRAEAVFGCTQTAERPGRFALEIQHAVYHMLEDLRSGERALLVYVTDDENGHVFVFRVLHQTHRAFLDLGRTAGSGS